jgi:hypothetical protein
VELYHRLTDTELQALPAGQQLEVWAFQNYLDAAARGAGKTELRMLGEVLEIIISQSDDQLDEQPGYPKVPLPAVAEARVR